MNQMTKLGLMLTFYNFFAFSCGSSKQDYVEQNRHAGLACPEGIVNHINIENDPMYLTYSCMQNQRVNRVLFYQKNAENLSDILEISEFDTITVDKNGYIKSIRKKT